MPKLKTLRALKKRVKITGKGKIKRAKATKSHLLEKKSKKRKRHLKKPTIVGSKEAKKLKRLLPYG